MGYTVNCGYKNTYGILGFNFNVVSSTYSYTAIEGALFDFINKRVCYDLLPNMTMTLFEQYIRSHIIKLSNRVEPSLVTAGDRNYFHHITERNFGFGLNDNVANFLMQEYNINPNIDIQDGVSSTSNPNTNTNPNPDSMCNATQSTTPSTSTKSIEDLKNELIVFATRLFRLGTSTSPSSTTSPSTSDENSNGGGSILIVRAYIDEMNDKKKDTVSPPNKNRKQSDDGNSNGDGNGNDDNGKCNSNNNNNASGKKRFCTCKSRRDAANNKTKSKDTQKDVLDMLCVVCEKPTEQGSPPTINVHQHMISGREEFISSMGVHPALL